MPTWLEHKNRWKAKVEYKGEKYPHLCKTKKEALEWEATMRKELRAQEQAKTVIGFYHSYEKYLDRVKVEMVKKTYDEKRSLLARFLPYTKVVLEEKDGELILKRDVPITDITSSMIDDFLVDRAKDVSNYSSNKDRKNLHAFFDWARVNYKIEVPVLPRKLPHDRKKKYAASIEDVLKLLAAATAAEKVFLNCYLSTGARPAEVFRLRWETDIRLNEGIIRLESRKNRSRELKEKWITMTASLKDDLTWWYLTKDRPFRDSEYVFVIPRGKFAGEPYSSRRWFMRTLCKRAGVPPMQLRDLRPTVASHLGQRGEPLPTIQALLRHEKATTTQGYLLEITGAVREATGTLEELWGKEAQGGIPLGIPFSSGEH
jgi:integrase